MIYQKIIILMSKDLDNVLHKNLYGILKVDKNADKNIIKRSYYKLSKEYHPDLNKVDDTTSLFKEICEAYNILSGDERVEYDNRSKWGNNYDESTELLNYEFNNNAKAWDESKFEDWKSQNQLNILVYINEESFNGTIEYERWVICKDCGGDGKDTTSKIQIKDENGNLIKMFDGSDGCDFCEGSGKNDWNGDVCYYCAGKGKVGWTDCKTCNGLKKILGKQKLKGVKFPKGEKAYKVESMGHSSSSEKGKVGHVWIINNSFKD